MKFKGSLEFVRIVLFNIANIVLTGLVKTGAKGGSEGGFNYYARCRDGCCWWYAINNPSLTKINWAKLANLLNDFVPV